jgi:amidase
VRPGSYDEADATALAELVRRGDTSPAELLNTAIERVEARNPAINAVIRPMFDEARRAIVAGLPDGPLRGVPFLLKDLLAHYAGVPTTCGSRLLERWVPTQDSEIVARYKRAGLVIFGKTNTPELGLLGVTEPKLHGATRNPWNTEHTPGGSSGGSAAAVAARMVPAAAAGDGGGSIRIPSSNCGLVGLRPTRGRVPLGPRVGALWSDLVVQHVVTRTVRDSALFLDVGAGPWAGAPHVAPAPERPFVEELGRAPGKLRIAICRETLLPGKLHADNLEAVDGAATLLAELGHEVGDAVPELDREALVRAYLAITSVGTAADVAEGERFAGRSASSDDLEPLTALAAVIGRKMSAATLVAHERAMAVAAWSLACFFERWDVLVTATTARPPAKIGEFDPPPVQQVLMRVVRAMPLRRALDQALEMMAADPQIRAYPNTQPFNMTGQPAISLPLHWTSGGLPVGVQLVARFGDEATLFRLASQLETAKPWAQRKPPLAARGSA